MSNQEMFLKQMEFVSLLIRVFWSVILVESYASPFALQRECFTAASAFKNIPCSSYTTMTNLVLPSQKQDPKCFESSSFEIIISATHQRTLLLTPKTIQKLVKGNKKTTSTTINIHKSHQNAQPNAASVTGRSLARSQGPTKRLGWKRRHLNQLHHVQDG